MNTDRNQSRQLYYDGCHWKITLSIFFFFFRKLWQPTQTQSSSSLSLSSMEKVTCCSKMQLSVLSTRATWTTALSSEKSFTVSQKPSSTAHTLVRLRSYIYTCLTGQQISKLPLTHVRKVNICFSLQQTSWSFVIRTCAAYFNGHTEGHPAVQAFICKRVSSTCDDCEPSLVSSC